MRSAPRKKERNCTAKASAVGNRLAKAVYRLYRYYENLLLGLPGLRLSGQAVNRGRRLLHAATESKR